MGLGLRRLENSGRLRRKLRRRATSNLRQVRKLGLDDAATAIAIEDTPAGILSAKGAGLKVLAVTNSYDREYLLDADAVTDSLENISRLSLEDMVL